MDSLFTWFHKLSREPCTVPDSHVNGPSWAAVVRVQRDRFDLELRHAFTLANWAAVSGRNTCENKHQDFQEDYIKWCLTVHPVWVGPGPTALVGLGVPGSHVQPLGCMLPGLHEGTGRTSSKGREANSIFLGPSWRPRPRRLRSLSAMGWWRIMWRITKCWELEVVTQLSTLCSE